MPVKSQIFSVVAILHTEIGWPDVDQVNPFRIGTSGGIL
jgi:hypothetical protein